MLESYVTRTGDKKAALRFMKNALKRHGASAEITPDGLRSYKGAMKELGNADKQEVGSWANNRVENSHLAFQRRERAMFRFRQMKSLQKFASVHANVLRVRQKDGRDEENEVHIGAQHRRTARGLRVARR